MKASLAFLLSLLTLAGRLCAQGDKTDIMILGSDHLAQIYSSSNPNTDVLLPKRQQEIKELTDLAMRYRPDIIMVEVLPENQRKLDSLYALYAAGSLQLQDLDDGRSEVYQIAFRMARRLGLSGVHCVNAPGGTSQSILDNGENIDLYKKEGLALRAMVIEKMKAFQANELSLKDYILFINQPATYNKIHRLRYITPSRVRNGTFSNPDAMIDTAFIDPRYIGAELTSVFKNRDYKIYSNIVAAQMQAKAKRILLVIGAAHIGSLRSILRDDEDYRLVDTDKMLQR